MPATSSSPKRHSFVRPILAALAVMMAIATLIGAAAAFTVSRRGLSTRTEPSRFEELAARTMRYLATPAAVRNQRNPVAPTDDVLAEALGHYADHCAVCHANDGSGDVEIGRGLYPMAPDMRAAATQALSDGEMFSIIENGIRLTGMPAWGDGTPEGQRASWGLVHFVRRLPALTDEELERMEALNPKTPAQLREEEEARRFLQGEGPAPPAAPIPAHQGHRE
jgi:mono/diheme cytochrome c family protein